MDVEKMARECGFTPVNYSLETPPEADDVFLATRDQLRTYTQMVLEKAADKVQDMADIYLDQSGAEYLHDNGPALEEASEAIRALLPNRSRNEP